MHLPLLHRPAPRPRTLLALLAAALIAGTGLAQAADLPQAEAERHAQASYREYFELLSLPNDAIVPEDIRKNVDWLAKAFEKRGFATRQLDNDGKPMLYAELPGRDPARKTVLFYMHLDGQPVIPAQWAQKSPWTPVLKRRAADGGWLVSGALVILEENLAAEPEPGIDFELLEMREFGDTRMRFFRYS